MYSVQDTPWLPGEYTALCAAGVMTFEDGLKLVKLRGEAMQEAATPGPFGEIWVKSKAKPPSQVTRKVGCQEAADALRCRLGALQVGSTVPRGGRQGGAANAFVFNSMDHTSHFPHRSLLCRMEGFARWQIASSLKAIPLVALRRLASCYSCPAAAASASAVVFSLGSLVEAINTLKELAEKNGALQARSLLAGLLFCSTCF